MATKLKNIKHGFGTKLVAVILAAVLFFTAGYAASMAIRGFFFYNGYEDREFTQTTAFRWQLNSYIHEVIYEGRRRTIDSLEEYMQTDDGKELIEECNQRKTDTTDAYNLLKEKDIQVYVDNENRYRYTYSLNGLTYYFSFNGELISSEEFDPNSFVQISVPATNTTTTMPVTASAEHSTAVQVIVPSPPQFVESTTPATTSFDRGAYYPYDGRAVPVEIKEISDALRTLNDISDFTCYGEVPLDVMLTELQQMYDQTMVACFNDYGSNDQRMLNYVKRINYFVVYETGDVFTNCGLTAADSEEKILEKMGDMYVERFKDGKFTLVKGENPPEATNMSGELHESLYGGDDRESFLSRTDFASITDDVKAAYFGFVPATQPASEILDGFTLSEKGFHDFSRNPAFLKDTSTCVIIFAVTLLLAAAVCIYLLKVSGKTADGTVTYPIDRIPIEITSLVGIGIMILLGFAAFCLGVYESDTGFAYRYDDFINLIMYGLTGWYSAITGLLVSVFFLIWTGLTSIAVRNARNKLFWKRTLCYWALTPLRWVWKKIKGIYRKASSKIKFILACDYSDGKGKKFKTIACCAVAGFVVATIIYYAWVTCLLFAWGDEEIGVIFWILGIIGDIAIILFALLTVVSLDRIMAGAAQMRNGNLNTQIDTTRMPPFMRRFADDILSMQDGLQNAVESAVKDQRMKAELITNVSHDLKTPLTSIVSYVDLLKKCDVQDETAQKYITVLDEKAAKMKKLIEDLVEASKASTGAIEIHPVKINLCEFAAQAVGEHEDELKKFGMELVLRTPEKPVTVWADSQKTSRIVENLFSNIRKYAMEGTRVYVEVLGGSDYGTMVFKNISKYAIDVSADELTQRFVRGDSSRSGEGSGLGLSIAQNLCELQKGRFNVSVDGDLFKVTLELPAIR